MQKQIYINNTEHLRDFIQLNEDWIKKHYALEDVDRRLAANPAKIINRGGYVITMTLNNTVIGCCALIKHSHGIFEIARMTVAEEHQSRGYGQELLSYALHKLKELGEHRTFLLTNIEQKTAIALYKKNGFKVISYEQHPIYARCNMVMEHWL
ncbi:GNAT family N-acetyltransferase [Teredinibacter sp. KSP-S5-2]|uniref:GNAT family N-acetyltransferase n=1 Tax=Teredinibacter sp. KSP-S5-2 TaxID=3034506 RepID=UPI00293420CA|nr:GNAT family N-acetyltransferase [Teredinibacter sp. KSP-S5-2]WNO08793.1 GNAT family N-acetyltransferase [Teredinibacter sp. KSP-S5-2]